MTKQEEIREGIRQILEANKKEAWVCTCEICRGVQNGIIDQIFSYLHSQGVVIKEKK